VGAIEIEVGTISRREASADTICHI
jgi:hypothetical protein